MTEKKYDYEEGQRVYFNIDGKIQGWAKIRGVTTIEMPEIGRNWIIEPEEPIPFSKTTYPFSHICAFSCQLDDEKFELGSSKWSIAHKKEKKENADVPAAS